MSSISDTPVIADSVSAGLTDRNNQWLSVVHSTTPADKDIAERAIKALYAAVAPPNSEEPAILWCQSPWQLVAMCAALQTGFTRTDSRKLDVNPGSNHTQKEIDDLWEKLWRQIDIQVDDAVRQKFLRPKLAKAQANWFDDVPFFSKKERSAEPDLSAMPSSMVVSNQKIFQSQIKLTKELHGVCGIRLADNAKYAQLKQQYETQLRSRLQENPTTQLRANLMTMTSFPFHPDFSQLFSMQNLVKFGFEAVRGNAQAEFDKAYAPEDRKLFHFLIATITGTASLTFVPSVVDWLPFYEYLCEELPWLPVGPTNKRLLRCYLDVARGVTNCMFLDKVVLVSQAPLVFKTDENGRLHSESGPALRFSDGYQLHVWHGTTVPREVIDNPSAINVDSILKELNAEVRRVKIDRYGMSRFIVDSGAEKIHEDECGILYKKTLFNDEPIVMVKVLNSTPEPDGSIKSYFLRVPPTITTAREAVAWTFEMKPEDYRPRKQT